MHRSRVAWMVVIGFASAVGGPAGATAQAPSAEPAPVGPIRDIAGRVHVGHWGYDPVTALPGLRGTATGTLGVTVYPEATVGVVGLDLDAFGLSRAYRSVVVGAAEEETSLGTAGFSLGARVGVPTSTPVGVYGAFGLAYMSHTMKVAGLPAWFLPGIGQTWEDEDGGWGGYWGGGVEARAGRVGMSLDFRSFRSTASFDEPFAMRDLPLGGTVWYLGAFFRTGSLSPMR